MGVYILSNSTRLTPGIVRAVANALGVKPKEVIAQNTIRTEFYTRWCWRYIYAMFKFNLPETWDKGYFMKHLLKGSGILGVTDTKFGIVALKCSPYGLNLYEHPTNLTFAVPALATFDREIGVDCVPLFMDDLSLELHVSPLVNCVNYFAEILAQCDGTISQNLMNSRVLVVVESEDKREAATARALIESLYSGEPVAFTKTGMAGKINILQAKNSYVSNEIQDLKRALKNDFLSMFGYNNTNYTKKARQTVSEVDSNNAEIVGGITYWLETLREQMKQANELFGLNLSVEMRPWAEVEEIVGTEEDG